MQEGVTTFSAQDVELVAEVLLRSCPVLEAEVAAVLLRSFQILEEQTLAEKLACDEVVRNLLDQNSVDEDSSEYHRVHHRRLLPILLLAHQTLEHGSLQFERTVARPVLLGIRRKAVLIDRVAEGKRSTRLQLDHNQLLEPEDLRQLPMS